MTGRELKKFLTEQILSLIQIGVKTQIALARIYRARTSNEGLNGIMIEVDRDDPGFWALEENIKLVTAIGKATETEEAREKAERLRSGKRG
tara:strand:- start:245 stop:517 length:273 start_codon:yes stop_codon:yes gene_type:complete